MRGARAKLLLALGTVGVVAAVSASTVVALMAWRIVDPVGDELVRADAIVVLSGEQRRVQRGLELIDDGWSPLLVVSSGRRWDAVAERCGSGEMSSVWCPEPEENSTRGEARMIAQLISENGWRSVIVVTSGYHVARARLLVDRCIGDDVEVVWALAESARPSPGLVRLEIAKRVHSTIFERKC